MRSGMYIHTPTDGMSVMSNIRDAEARPKQRLLGSGSRYTRATWLHEYVRQDSQDGTHVAAFPGRTHGWACRDVCVYTRLTQRQPTRDT